MRGHSHAYSITSRNLIRWSYISLFGHVTGWTWLNNATICRTYLMMSYNPGISRAHMGTVCTCTQVWRVQNLAVDLQMATYRTSAQQGIAYHLIFVFHHVVLYHVPRSDLQVRFLHVTQWCYSWQHTAWIRMVCFCLLGGRQNRILRRTVVGHGGTI